MRPRGRQVLTGRAGSFHCDPKQVYAETALLPFYKAWGKSFLKGGGISCIDEAEKSRIEKLVI